MAWVIGIGIFLFLLFAFPRAMGGLIVLCGLAIGGFLLWEKLERDNRARERAAISITPGCPARCAEGGESAAHLLRQDQRLVAKTSGA